MLPAVADTIFLSIYSSIQAILYIPERIKFNEFKIMVPKVHVLLT